MTGMMAVLVVWVAGLTVILGLIGVAIRWVAAADTPSPLLLPAPAQRAAAVELLEPVD